MNGGDNNHSVIPSNTLLALLVSSSHISSFSSHYGARLRTHPNHLAANLLGEPVYRRLRRYLPNDLPDRF
jgi:hypothetical protein